MKNDFKATFNNVIVKELESPIKKNMTEAGIIIPDNDIILNKNTNTGEMEQEKDIFLYGEVMSAGDDCKIKEGSKVFYHFRAFTSLPFFRDTDLKEVGVINERDIIAYAE